MEHVDERLREKENRNEKIWFFKRGKSKIEWNGILLPKIDHRFRRRKERVLRWCLPCSDRSSPGNSLENTLRGGGAERLVMVLLRMKRGLQWWWLFLHQDFGLAGIKEIR